MKTGVIAGSHRREAQSLKVARHAEQRLRDLQVCDDTWLFSLSENPLPLWDEAVFEPSEHWNELLGPIRRSLSECDAFVIVTPEWHGMVPAGLKNFFLLLANKGEVAHKPALIVTVSASDNGAYPVAELRMSSYKNNRICYIPEHVIVRRVKSVFNPEPEANDPEAQEYLSGRLDYCLELLGEYARAFRGIRDSGKASLEPYPNGM